jgi:hypothetical protein
MCRAGRIAGHRARGRGGGELENAVNGNKVSDKDGSDSRGGKPSAISIP